MVAYTDRIPGTDATFIMIPCPGGEDRSQLPPFWIGRCEVSMPEYREFMKLDQGFRAIQRKRQRLVTDQNVADAVSAPSTVYMEDWRFGFAENARYKNGGVPPAVSMTRFAARQYTKWLTLSKGKASVVQYRLPTEVEWEHACRAGTKTNWSFGNDRRVAAKYCVHFDEKLASAGVAHDGPAPIGQREPNAWGIHDMHGNVAEWVLQRRHIRDDKSLSRPGNRKSWDQAKAEALQEMILRGGDWTKSIEHCRCSIRERATKELWEQDPGFPHSPNWIASEELTRVGFRIVSPLIPHQRDELERYWSSDSIAIHEAARLQQEDGLSVRGLVDNALPEIVKGLDESR